MPTSDDVFGSVDISTRPKRRRAVSLIIKELGSIHYEEYACLGRIPANMHNSDAYAAADYSLDMLIEAINCLEEAY
jgi:hypothetical protein